MPKTTAALAAILVLAACGDDRDISNESAVPPATESPAPDATPTPSPTPAAPKPGAALPPADADLRFLGRWAADAGACGDPWIWTDRRLATPAGTVCEFTEVERAPGGYDIEARCTAEGPPADDRIELRFAESARSMLVESEKTLAPVGLIYCGE